MNQPKQFRIPKETVWEAYKRVKANHGACGVDQVSIQEFEGDLEGNLYKIWNRMSSGSYFPPPVLCVDIPKKDGSQRRLGIPTVGDRIAQMVVKEALEGRVEQFFHPDSYGYRPKKSALEAVGQARERCWRYPWVLDLDIQSFFDNLDHELTMKAVRHHTQEKWIILYIQRWLKAPLVLQDGSTIKRNKGTPQGGVISPLLANLFLHYAFDKWMTRNFPRSPFERYADDIVVHCRTKKDALKVRSAVELRLKECKLTLHSEKTKIVYCKGSSRKRNYPDIQFDFLGYTFRPRKSRDKRGAYFLNFSPAISNKEAKRIRQIMRSWRLHMSYNNKTLQDIALKVNPVLRGWINYYGRYYKVRLGTTLRHFNRILVRWAMCKHKGLCNRKRLAVGWLRKIASEEPRLFVHWHLGVIPS